MNSRPTPTCTSTSPDSIFHKFVDLQVEVVLCFFAGDESGDTEIIYAFQEANNEIGGRFKAP